MSKVSVNVKKGEIRVLSAVLELHFLRGGNS